MASLARSSLLPQCTACTRRIARSGMAAAPATAPAPLQHVRYKSKAAKEAERNVTVKLLQDVRRWGRAGAFIPLNPSRMRNRWFPMRLAEYVPQAQLKQLKADGVTAVRDTEFGVQQALQEEPDADWALSSAGKSYVRPVEVDYLSPERSMELLTTFIPPTIEFARQAIEQDRDAGPARHYGSSDAADILTAAAMAGKPKVAPNAIYGSVSTADVAALIKGALAHNDEAARVILAEHDVRFVVDGPEADATRVKQLGNFKVEIQVPGAEAPIIRTVRIRAKDMSA